MGPKTGAAADKAAAKKKMEGLRKDLYIAKAVATAKTAELEASAAAQADQVRVSSQPTAPAPAAHSYGTLNRPGRAGRRDRGAAGRSIGGGGVGRACSGRAGIGGAGRGAAREQAGGAGGGAVVGPGGAGPFSISGWWPHHLPQPFQRPRADADWFRRLSPPPGRTRSSRGRPSSGCRWLNSLQLH